MNRMFFALALALGIASVCEAGPFGLFGRRTSNNNSSNSRGPVGSVFLGTAQAVANHMSRIGRIGHFGGNPYTYEGVGMGSTPYQAEMNCCYRKQKTPVDVGVAQGSNGMWFACCRYN